MGPDPRSHTPDPRPLSTTPTAFAPQPQWLLLHSPNGIGSITLMIPRSQLPGFLIPEIPARGGPAAGGVAHKIRRAAFTRSQRRLESCCPRHFAEGRQIYKRACIFLGSEASYTHASGAPSRNQRWDSTPSRVFLKISGFASRPLGRQLRLPVGTVRVSSYPRSLALLRSYCSRG